MKHWIWRGDKIQQFLHWAVVAPGLFLGRRGGDVPSIDEKSSVISCLDLAMEDASFFASIIGTGVPSLALAASYVWRVSTTGCVGGESCLVSLAACRHNSHRWPLLPLHQPTCHAPITYVAAHVDASEGKIWRKPKGRRVNQEIMCLDGEIIGDVRGSILIWLGMRQSWHRWFSGKGIHPYMDTVILTVGWLLGAALEVGGGAGATATDVMGIMRWGGWGRRSDVWAWLSHEDGSRPEGGDDGDLGGDRGHGDAGQNMVHGVDAYTPCL
jgi:hypothetical protein